MNARTLSALALLLLSLAAEAGPRSRVVLRDFQRDHPCPATGERRGACPGFHIDHIQPLCASGRDTVDNLQWLSTPDHALKTRRDVSACFGRVHRPPA